MAATVTMRVFTTGGAVMSAAQTGIDLCSEDSATNTPVHRLAEPVGIGVYSFEKWIKLRLDSAPPTQITTIKVWGDGVVKLNTRLHYGFTTVFAAPVCAPSTIATLDWTALSAGAPATWDTGVYVGVGLISTYLVMQLYAEYCEDLFGTWTQETINYSYVET